MDKIKYENKYGKLEIEVSEYKHISEITSKNVNTFFDIETAEKIALITGNRGIQICVSPDLKRFYLVHHKSYDIVSVAKVVTLEYLHTNIPREELQKSTPILHFIPPGAGRRSHVK